MARLDVFNCWTWRCRTCGAECFAWTSYACTQKAIGHLVSHSPLARAVIIPVDMPNVIERPVAFVDLDLNASATDLENRVPIVPDRVPA